MKTILAHNLNDVFAAIRQHGACIDPRLALASANRQGCKPDMYRQETLSPFAHQATLSASMPLLIHVNNLDIVPQFLTTPARITWTHLMGIQDHPDFLMPSEVFAQIGCPLCGSTEMKQMIWPTANGEYDTALGDCAEPEQYWCSCGAIWLNTENCPDTDANASWLLIVQPAPGFIARPDSDERLLHPAQDTMNLNERQDACFGDLIVAGEAQIRAAVDVFGGMTVFQHYLHSAGTLAQRVYLETVLPLQDASLLLETKEAEIIGTMTKKQDDAAEAVAYLTRFPGSALEDLWLFLTDSRFHDAYSNEKFWGYVRTLDEDDPRNC